MNRLTLFIPFALCLALGAFLFFSLGKDPLDLPSALVDEAFPEFALEELHEPERQLSTDDFDGQVLLVNVWATWCFACRVEHPWLNSLAKEGVVIVGLNYKDHRKLAQDWLQERGDPYQFSIFDPRGVLVIDLGVYGRRKPTWLMPRALFVTAVSVWLTSGCGMKSSATSISS